jgi:hypothetical protein
MMASCALAADFRMAFTRVGGVHSP